MAMMEKVPPTDCCKVLCVGLACIDLVNIVAEFPQEDSDKRGQRYYWQRGGNASNNSTVLTLLSAPCDFMGVLGTRGPEASWIVADFHKCGISTERCVRKDVQCSVATVIVSRDAGTRTIIYHPRDHPELTFEDFDKEFNGDFSSYSWIHFELTRKVSDVCKMMDSILSAGCTKSSADTTEKSARLQSRPVVSVELEKPEILDAEEAMSRADVVFISKDFARSRGYRDAAEALRGLYTRCAASALLVCAWGELGASACFGGDINSLTVLSCPALSGISVVDSLGAGDSFVAGVIYTLVQSGFTPDSHLRGKDQAEVVEKAVSFGCRVAGLKCTIFGYDGIRELVHSTESATN